MYNQRVWLNGKNAPSTGALVAYHGKSPYGKGTTEFLELSDCHSSVRLHRAKNDSRKMFIQKLKLLVRTINKFIKHLESLK